MEFMNTYIQITKLCTGAFWEKLNIFQGASKTLELAILVFVSIPVFLLIFCISQELYKFCMNAQNKS